MDAEQFKLFLDHHKKMVEALSKLSVSQETNYNKNESELTENLISSISARLESFEFDEDAGKLFKNWFERYGAIIEKDGAALDDNAKVRLLVGKLKSVEFQKFADSIRPKGPYELSFVETKQQMELLFAPIKSVVARRFEMFRIKRKSGQDLQSYYAELNSAVELAKPPLSSKDLKSLLFISGLGTESQDEELQSICLKLMERERSRNNDISVEQLLQECQKFYDMKESLDKLSGLNFKQVNATRIGQNRSHNWDRVSKKVKCSRCGQGHLTQKCMHKNIECFKCKKLGHFAKMCKSKTQDYGSKSYHTGITHRERVKTGAVQILAVSKIKCEEKPLRCWLRINNIKSHFFLDTGADETLLTYSTWLRLKKPKLTRSENKGKDYSGNEFNLLGYVSLNVQYENEPTMILKAFVLPSDRNKFDVIGRSWIIGLKFLHRLHKVSNIKGYHINTIEINSKILDPDKEVKVSKWEEIETSDQLCKMLKVKFPNVVDNALGHCTKMKASLQLKDDVKPVFIRKRPVPVGVENMIKEELDRLERSNVIKSVEFSDWSAPIVAIKKKNGNLRICADFSTGLNERLELNRHPLPSPESIYNAVQNCKIFSHIDLADAYLQIELDEKSKKLVTINTHLGLYEYQRLPFGVKSAPSIFQKLMDTLLQNIKGAFSYLDDLIIASKDKDEHINTMLVLFNKLKEYGLKVRLEKCKFMVHQLEFLGKIVDETGIKPSPNKVKAVVDMPEPTNVSEVRSFLGAITYYGKFIKQMREIRAPLDELLKKEVKFNWTNECKIAFEKAKGILISDLALTHFDPKLPIMVAADASQHGIGAVISHKFPDGNIKAIEHASKALTKAERNYSQIEKEALALVFAIKKFHRMIYGRKFTLLTDHKPLLAIFGSKTGIPIHSASRLQRWALILLGYDFNIEHVRSNQIGQADVLSRLIVESKNNNEDIVIAQNEIFLKIFSSQLESLPVSLEELIEETNKDEISNEVKEYVQKGWPKKINEGVLSAYHAKRNELSMHEKCLVLGERVVIPKSLRSRVLKTLHFGHPGIVRMKLLARRHVYWPSLNSDIEQTVRSCNNCIENSKTPKECEPQSWKAEKKPWVRLHIDYAGPFKNNMFLIVVDAFSKWVEVAKVKEISSKATIVVLRNIFTRFGLPSVLVSDNGRQFSSNEFQLFLKNSGITYVSTPPYHPKSNGQVERYVDIFKRGVSKIMGKHINGGEEELDNAVREFLQSYRFTPNVNLNGKSPAEMLLGWQPQSLMDKMKPDKNKGKQSLIEHTASNKLRSFKLSQKVYFKQFNIGKEWWCVGTIKKRLGTVVYLVEDEGGKLHKRHTNQIRSKYTGEDSLELGPEELQNTEKPVENNVLRRMSTRQRNSIVKLNVQPSSKYYR